MSRFIKNAVAYSGANIVAQAAKVGQELVLRRLLAPEVLGIWNFAVVVQGFGATFDVGMGTAAEREIPLFEGGGQFSDAKTARSTALWSKVAQTILVGACIVGYATIVGGHEGRGGRAGLLAGAVLLAAYAITESFITFHQASQKYVGLSRSLLVASLSGALLLCLGGWLGHAWSILVAGLLAAVLQASILTLSARLNGVRIERAWRAPVFRRLLSYGLPFRLVDYPLSLFPVIDSMFVARVLGLEALAIYATAKVVLTQSIDVPARFGAVFISRLFNQAGANRSRAELADDLARFLTVSHLCLIPCVVLAVASLAPFGIALFLPRYAASLPVLKILILAIFFVPQTTLVRNFWLLDRRLFRVGLANVVSLAGFIGIATLVMLTRGVSLSSVAVTLVGGYAFLFLYLMATVGREIWGMRSMLRVVALVLFSFAYSAIVMHLVLSDSVVPGVSAALTVLVRNLVKSAVLLSPIIAFAVWRTGLLRQLAAARARAVPDEQ